VRKVAVFSPSPANERMHSPATRINSRLRARMKPDSVERLTMAYLYLRKAANELAEMLLVRRQRGGL
jgi:hypothetical protein